MDKYNACRSGQDGKDGNDTMAKPGLKA